MVGNCSARGRTIVPVRRLPVLALCLAGALAAPLRARTALDDLEDAKARFARGDYEGSLTVLDGIDRNLRELGAGDARRKIAAPLAFYRAADYAMLGARDDAASGFAGFLRLAPGAELDPKAWPPAVVSAFEQARRKAPRDSPIAAAFAAFVGGTRDDETDPRGDLSRGPLASLLTAAERREGELPAGASERARRIEEFWRRRPPDSGIPRREEIDRRIAFADARFRDGETRGSLTDRGQVFLLLGPPDWVGVKPLSGAEDPSVGQRAEDILPLPPGATSGMIAEHNRAVDTNPTLSYSAQRNMRETWHYRTLPPGIPARAADLDFVTREGGGLAQLARTPRTLRVLEAVRRLWSAAPE
jgi:GWxTD domain-containing protein